MKQCENKGSIKEREKARTLFSKLKEPDIAGFSDHNYEASRGKPLPAKDNLTVQNKSLNSLSSCQHKKYCHEQFNCKPGAHLAGWPIAIDFWYY